MRLASMPWMVPVALALLAACAPTGPPPSILHVSGERQPAFEALVGELESAMRDRGIPGAAIAIAERGALAHAAGLGLRDRREAGGVTPDTTFRIASISKLVLALAVLSLVDSGALRLDAQVGEFVPGFFAPITLRQALNHTSGLADSGEPRCPVGPGAIDAWLAAYAPRAVWAPPGAVWNYANPNYAVVASVIEHATGQRFEDVVAERVFSRAGVTATYDPALARAPVAFMHPAQGGDPLPLDALDCAMLRAAGGVMISVVDFMKVLALVDAVRMLDQSADMHRGGDSRYGLGVSSVRTRAGELAVMHGGGMPGLQTLFVATPDFAVAAFFNGDAPIGPALSEAIARYRGTTAGPPETTPPPFAPFAGVYDDLAHGLRVEVSQSNGGLWARFTRAGLDQRAELRWLGGDTFLVDWPVGAGTDRIAIEATFFPGYLATRVGVARRL